MTLQATNTSYQQPVTAGVEQAKANPAAPLARTENAQALDVVVSIPSAAKQDQTTNPERPKRDTVSNAEQVTIAAEKIRISTTLGQAEIRGNLTKEKAAELYEKIARLI